MVQAPDLKCGYEILLQSYGVGPLRVNIVLMNWLGTPAATFVVALPVLFAAAIASRGWARIIPVPLVIGLSLLSWYAGQLLGGPPVRL